MKNIMGLGKDIQAKCFIYDSDIENRNWILLNTSKQIVLDSHDLASLFLKIMGKLLLQQSKFLRGRVISLHVGLLFVMKILFWNIKGISDPSKRSRFNQITSGVCPNWVGLQESKLREVDDLIIGHIFQTQNVDYALSPVIDISRGIIYCWNSSTFMESCRSCYPRFVAIKGFLAGGDGPKGLICVYDLTNVKIMWRCLTH